MRREEDRDAARDPLAHPEAVIDALAMPMAERLELALTWNALAVELRAGLAATLGRATRERD